MQELKERAKELFLQGDYAQAHINYMLVLEYDPEDAEAKIGVLLCELSTKNELEARELFDIFLETQLESTSTNKNFLDDLEDIFDFEIEIDIEEIEFSEEMFEYENGIEYRDFKYFVDDRGDFIKALEDLMFSTKLIIKRKEDFVEFISLLFEHGYKNSALNYLENAMMLYPYEDFFVKSIKKLES